MKPINRLKRREEDRRKEKALTNEQVSQSRTKREEKIGCRVGWVRGAAGLGQRLTRSGEGGHSQTAGHCARTPGTGRHTQTHSLIHTLTRPCTQAHASAHCHTDLRWHLGGQPHLQSSPGCRSWSTIFTSVHLTSADRAPPPLLHSLPGDRTKHSGPSVTTPDTPADPRKKRSRNAELSTKRIIESASLEDHLSPSHPRRSQRRRHSKIEDLVEWSTIVPLL